jgi:hypothetical protein
MPPGRKNLLIPAPAAVREASAPFDFASGLR